MNVINRKISFCILLCAVILSIISGCGKSGSKEKDKAAKDVISRAEQYILSKYDMKAEVVELQEDYELEGFDFIIPHKNYTGTYSLKMNSDGTEFNVCVGEEMIADDYQFPEINESLEALFADMLHLSDIRVQFSADLLSDFIDCSDMKSFLYDHYSDVRIYLVDADLNSAKLDEVKSFARSCGSTIWLMSCRSRGDRDTLIDGRHTEPRGDAASTPISLGSDYAMYVKEIWKCSYSSQDASHTEEYNELRIGNYGNLYYTVPEKSDIVITKSDADHYYDKYSDKKYKLITPAYNLGCTDNFTVFFPVGSAENIELEYYQAYKCGGNQVDIIGDYFVYRVHNKQWYEDRHYYKDGDERVFGVYIDNYY